MQFLHEVEQIAHGLPVDDLAQIHLREEVYFTHIEFVLIAKFLYFLEELHQSVAAGLCTEFYFAYHSRKVTALEILVDIAYGTMYLTFILGKLAYRFGDALNDVCIAFADLFLKIEDLIIIHKLAEVGGKIQIVFLRRQIGAETERVLGREVAFKQINHPFEFFQLFHAAGDMVFQLLHQLCATLLGLPLFGHYYFGWAESGVFVKFGGLCQTFLQASLCFDALA